MSIEDASLNLVQTWQEAEQLLDWLARGRRNVLAVDTETGGTEWWKDELRLVQVGDLNEGWAIPWQEWGGLVKEVFRRWDGDVVMHNAKFDERFLRRNGVAIPRARIHDTQTMTKLVDSSALKGLKPSASRLVDPRLSGLQDDLSKAFTKYKWNWHTIPVDFPDYWRYAALDTILCASLYERLAERVSRDYVTAYELDCGATWVVSDMEERGARIDVPYCEQKMEELGDYVSRMTDYIRAEWSCGTSDREVSTKLIRDGVKLEKRTDSGQWSVAKEILENIDHPLAEAILSRRQAQKMASAYFRNLINFRDGDVVHPDVDLLGTHTGRMSISRPALQQVPSGRSPAGTAVRDAFIAREGNRLIDIDYDQEEQRLVASFSRDEGMLAAFAEADRGGVDFFTTTARVVYGDPTLQRDDVRRQRIKNAMYARSYGAGPPKVALTARISEQEAVELFAAQDAAFPRLVAWQQEVQRGARDRLSRDGKPSVDTPWGRRLIGDEETIYAMVNYLVQGTAADVLKQKLCDLDAAGLSQYAVLPVHDELLFDVPADAAEELAVELVEVMQEKDRFIAPLTCDAHIGDKWGSIH